MTDQPKSFFLSGRCFVVHERENPTTDYYLRPRLRRHPDVEVFWHRFDAVPPAAELADATIIFVRYIPALWRRLVEGCRSRLRRLIFLMDDDLLDRSATEGLPVLYRWKILRLATWQRGWLERMRAELWVSTPFLAEKYADMGARVVPPLPLVEQAPPPCVFSHATASHHAELEWLRPVIEQVLERKPEIGFELTGDRRITRFYRDIPQVTVTPPTPWVTFRRFSEVPGRRIGLAPVLDTPFNRARSPTRFFDITRAGAVGLYSETGPCRSLVAHNVEGLLLPNQPAQWAAAVLNLIEDEPRRLSLLTAARARIERLAFGKDI